MLRRIFPLLALLLLPRLAAADGFMQVSDRSLQPMAVKYHKVDVTIDNQVATTEVDEVFLNPNPGQIEATYMFPVPAGASISKLSMWINGVEQEAELLDADKARKTYEDIVRSMRDPALLEYVGQKMFKLRVFPILPGEAKRVKLSYSETIPADNGLCIYRYPLNTEKFSSKPLEECRVSVKIKSNVPLKSLMSPTHTVDVARKNDFEGTVVFEAANVTPDKDFLLYFTQQAGDLGMNMVAQRSAAEDGYFMLLVSPKTEAGEDEIVKRDVCFVLDTSMSMTEEDRMTQAKKALKAGLQTLNPGDRFNIVAFSTEVRKWKDTLVDSSGENLKGASEYIDGLKARGGTNISEALATALGMAPGDPARPYMIIFMTDGEPTLGETDPEKIAGATRAANKANARIFTLGVGFDLNANLLDTLAAENKGLREYITPTENLETKMAGYYEKIGAPVLADVKLEMQGDGTEIYDVYPKQISDLFKGQQITVFGRFKGEGSRSIRLKGTVNGKAREFVYEASFPKESATHSAVPRLWAISKVGHLMDAIRLNGEKDELKKEIVALAKEFGIVTRYTSFLVLEDSARPQSAGARRDVFERKGIPAGGGGGAASDPKAPAPPEEPAVSFPDAEESDHNEAAGDDPAKMKGDAKDFLDAAGGRKATGKGSVDASKEAEEMKRGRENGGLAARRKKGDSGVTNIGDKTFYFGSGTWIDGSFKPGTETLKVEYLSDEYFKLLSDKPELSKYFALGEHVIVVVGDKAYEVAVAEAKK